MNKAVLLVFLVCTIFLASAQYCGTRTCVNPDASNAGGLVACGETAHDNSMCPTGYQCNSTSGINGVCVKMLGLGDHGCRPGSQYGPPVECYSSTQDIECNVTTGYCQLTRQPLGLGETGCQQEPYCAGQLYCQVNLTYPDESSPLAWTCVRINASVGASCEGDEQCAGSFLCNTETQICYERYSKPVGDSCEELLECQPGLACKGGACNYVASSNFKCNASSGAGSCSVVNEFCYCPDGYLGGEQATCLTEWGPVITADYAKAEVAILDCMWQNCASVDSYNECPQCTTQLCNYYDQLALNGQVFARDSPLFSCGEVEAEINDFICKLDPNYVASVCTGPVTTTGTTTPGVTTASSNNNDSSAAGVAVNLLAVLFVVISLLL